MKKRILALAAAAVMIVSSTVSVFADTTVIGQYKFDGNLKNEVTGEDATPVMQKITGEAAGATFTYVDGVDGSAIAIGQDGDTNGIDLNVAPTDGQAYTISVWAKSTGVHSVNGFATPIVWAGKKTQSPESWVGIWPGLATGYAKGPALGSNDSAGLRVGVIAAKSADITTQYGAGSADDANVFDWMNITITVDGGEGRLYYNGTLVGVTAEGSALPDIIADGDDTVSVYLGANAWDCPFTGYIDNLYVFDGVMTADEVAKHVDDTITAEGITLVEYDKYDEGAEAPQTTFNPPQVADPNASYLVAGDVDEADEDGGFPVVPVVIAVVAVVVIVVVVVIAVAASKKKSDDDDDDEE